MEILDVKNRDEFYKWMLENSEKEKECYVVLKRGKPKNDGLFYYIDAIEVVLCFGWIDSVLTGVDGKIIQRFSPRTKNSPWTELNKERVRRLEKLGLMTGVGRKTLPDLNEKFVIDDEYITLLKKNGAYENFMNFPELYQRIRIYNLRFHKKHSKNDYEKMLKNFIENTKNNKMYGEWNDYGRLLDY